MKLFAISLGLASLAYAQAPEPKKGIVRGSVINAKTKEPIRRAEVTIQPTGGQGMVGAGAGPMMAAQAKKGITDNEGNFVIENVEAGSYYVMPMRQGFVRPRGGSRGGGASRITVAEGQELTGLKFELMPQAILAGRVVDEEGEPMQGLRIQALGNNPGVMVPGRGRGSRGRTMMPLSGGQTDDRGEFRIINLPPGNIVLQVMPIRFGGPAAAASQGTEGETGYVTTYFPGVHDPSQATKIEVTPGAELSGFEFRLQKTRVYRIRGKVIDPNGQTPQNYFVGLMPRDDVFSGFGFNPGAFQRLPEGGFELHNVAPGAYTLQAQTGGGPRGSIAREPVDVGSQNVDGVVIRLRAPVTVTGSVSIEASQGTPADQQIDLASVRVALQGDSPMMSPPGLVKEDGQFQIENVSPGKYRISAMGVQNGYLGGARYGETDVSTEEFEIGDSPAPIKIILATGGGSVAGTVTDEDKPATGTAFLVPAEVAKRMQSTIRIMPLDQNGAFTAKNIAPGDYLAFAFVDADYGFWQDDEEMKKLESKGKKVSVAKTGTESITLTVIK